MNRWKRQRACAWVRSARQAVELTGSVSSRALASVRWRWCASGDGDDNDDDDNDDDINDDDDDDDDNNDDDDDDDDNNNDEDNNDEVDDDDVGAVSWRTITGRKDWCPLTRIIMTRIILMISCGKRTITIWQDGKIGARCSDSGARETEDGCRWSF